MILPNMEFKRHTVLACLVYSMVLSNTDAAMMKVGLRPVHESATESSRTQIDKMTTVNVPPSPPPSYANPLAGSNKSHMTHNAKLYAQNQQAMFNAERNRQQRAQVQRYATNTPKIDSYMQAYREEQEMHHKALETQQMKQAKQHKQTKLHSAVKNAYAKNIPSNNPKKFNEASEAKSNVNDKPRNQRSHGPVAAPVVLSLQRYADSEAMPAYSFTPSQQYVDQYSQGGVDIQPHSNIGVSAGHYGPQPTQESHASVAYDAEQYEALRSNQNENKVTNENDLHALQILLTQKPNEQLSGLNNLLHTSIGGYKLSSSEHDKKAGGQNIELLFYPEHQAIVPRLNYASENSYASGHEELSVKDHTPITENVQDIADTKKIKLQTYGIQSILATEPPKETTTTNSYYKIEVGSQSYGESSSNEHYLHNESTGTPAYDADSDNVSKINLNLDKTNTSHNINTKRVKRHTKNKNFKTLEEEMITDIFVTADDYTNSNSSKNNTKLQNETLPKSDSFADNNNIDKIDKNKDAKDNYPDIEIAYSEELNSYLVKSPIFLDSQFNKYQSNNAADIMKYRQYFYKDNINSNKNTNLGNQTSTVGYSDSFDTSFNNNNLNKYQSSNAADLLKKNLYFRKDNTVRSKNTSLANNRNSTSLNSFETQLAVYLKNNAYKRTHNYTDQEMAFSEEMKRFLLRAPLPLLTETQRKKLAEAHRHNLHNSDGWKVVTHQPPLYEPLKEYPVLTTKSDVIYNDDADNYDDMDEDGFKASNHNYDNNAPSKGDAPPPTNQHHKEAIKQILTDEKYRTGEQIYIFTESELMQLLHRSKTAHKPNSHKPHPPVPSRIPSNHKHNVHTRRPHKQNYRKRLRKNQIEAKLEHIRQNLAKLFLAMQL